MNKLLYDPIKLLKTKEYLKRKWDELSKNLEPLAHRNINLICMA